LLSREFDCGLAQCEGMWAFAWYDRGRDTLLLSRDRFGEKPLYIWRRKEGIYFASEPKFLFALAGDRPCVNLHQLKRYLVNGYKSLYKGRETFFEHVFELPAGHCATIDSAAVYSEAPFWRATFPLPRQEMTYGEAVAGTRSRLMRSMEIRL